MKSLLFIILLIQVNTCLASNTIIAIVDEKPITIQSLGEVLTLKKSFDEKMALLNNEIFKLIQINKAKELGLLISNDDISRAIIEVANYNDVSIEKLKQHPDFKSLENQIFETLLILKLQDQIKKDIEIKVSIEELNKSCSNNDSNVKKQIKIAQIIITEVENNKSNLSQEILIKNFLKKLTSHISKGASFEALAKLHSQHPSYINGGLSNWLFIDNTLLESFDKLKKKEVSKIFKTQYGWGIGIKAEERFIDLNLKKCKKNLINLKLNEQYEEWLIKLKKSSNIEIFFNKL